MNIKNKILFVLFAFALFHVAQAQWQPMNGPQGRYVRSILCTDGLYYAATGGGVMVSSDKGLNWEFRNNGLTSCDTKCLVTYNDTVFLATDENIFRTTDGGLHWIPDPYIHNHYVKHILVHNGSLLASTYVQGVYQSTEGTQGEYVTGIFPSDVRYPYFMSDNDDAIFIATYRRGVYRSFDDGASWESCNNGLDSDVLGIYCHNGKVFATVLGQGVMVSSDNGDTWTSANLNKQAKGYAHLGDTLYAACIGQGVYVSYNNGVTWQDFNSNLASKNLWCMDARDGYIFVGDTQGHIYRGNSDGSGWIRTNTPSFLASVGNIGISNGRILAATHGSDMFYTDNGSIMYHVSYDGVLRYSSEQGSNWQVLNSPFEGVNYTTLRHHDNCLYLGTRDHGLHFTDNMGETWQNIDALPSDATIRRITTTDTIVAVGCEDGSIYLKYNHSDVWQQLDNIPVDGPILDISIDGEQLYASPMAGGIWHIELPPMPDAVAEFNEKVLTIAPNPASSYVAVSVSESLHNAELTVYDIQGKVCYNCKIQGDKHEISVSDFPAELYFVKVVGENTSIVRKAVIQQ